MARTFVVVGASTGLGRETARALARAHRVIVAGRDVERTRAAVPGAHAALRVDLADLDFRRRELTGWFGADRTDWSEALYASSLALCRIEHDPLRAAA